MPKCEMCNFETKGDKLSGLPRHVSKKHGMSWGDYEKKFLKKTETPQDEAKPKETEIETETGQPNALSLEELNRRFESYDSYLKGVDNILRGLSEQTKNTDLKFSQIMELLSKHGTPSDPENPEEDEEEEATSGTKTGQMENPNVNVLNTVPSAAPVSMRHVQPSQQSTEEEDFTIPSDALYKYYASLLPKTMTLYQTYIEDCARQKLSPGNLSEWLNMCVFKAYDSIGRLQFVPKSREIKSGLER